VAEIPGEACCSQDFALQALGEIYVASEGESSGDFTLMSIQGRRYTYVPYTLLAAHAEITGHARMFVSSCASRYLPFCHALGWIPELS